MIDDVVIVDAVVHACNMSPENQNPAVAGAMAGVRQVEVRPTTDEWWALDHKGQVLPGASSC